jgi:hypothetical protein
MDDVLVLIGADIQTNDLLEQVEGDGTRSEVFGRVESVTRAEWFEGGREGMNPALVFITPAVNYSGEPEAELQGVRYRIYRTYRKRDTDEVELYLEEKVGVANG